MIHFKSSKQTITRALSATVQAAIVDGATGKWQPEWCIIGWWVPMPAPSLHGKVFTLWGTDGEPAGPVPVLWLSQYNSSHAFWADGNYITQRNEDMVTDVTAGYPILFAITCEDEGVDGVGIRLWLRNYGDTQKRGGSWPPRTAVDSVLPHTITLGASSAGITGGLVLCIRDHHISGDDFDAIWNEGANDGNPLTAPLYLDNAAGGGNMTGPDGVLWATWGMMSNPTYKDTGPGGTDHGPVPGNTVVERMMIYDPAEDNNPAGISRWAVNRDVIVDQGSRPGPFFIDPYDDILNASGVFKRTTLQDPIVPAEDTYTTGNGTVLSRELATDRPQTTRRVVTYSNSRSSYEGRDYYGRAPNYCGGLSHLLDDNMIGVDCFQLPPRTADGNQGELGQFSVGFNFDDRPKMSDVAGTVIDDLAGTSACRMSLGARLGSDEGCGSAREIQQGESLRLMFDEDGALKKTRAMRCSIYILKYPGGGSYQIQSVRDVKQSYTEAEVSGGFGDVIHTSTPTDEFHAFTVADSYTPGAGADDPADLVLNAVLSDVEVGMVCVWRGTPKMAVVTSVAPDVPVGFTSIVLEHHFAGGTGTSVGLALTSTTSVFDVSMVGACLTIAGVLYTITDYVSPKEVTLDNPPGAVAEAFYIHPTPDGTTLDFGAWDYLKQYVDHDALDEDEIVKWRGWEMTVQAGTRGVVVLGVGVWATDRWGWVLIGSGMGGARYSYLLDKTNRIGPSGTTSDGALNRWLSEIIAPDISILVETFNETDHVEEWIDLVENVSPDSEIILFGSGLHGWFLEAATDTPKASNVFMITTANSRGLPGVTIYNTGGVGRDKWAAGEPYDGSAHYNSMGNKRMMESFINLLDTATDHIPDPPVRGTVWNMAANNIVL